MGVVSSITALPMKLYHIAKRGSALTAAKLYANVNGLHEILTGAPPPGAQSVLIFPHDHSGEDLKLGCPLARNNLYSYDTGDISNPSSGWQVTGFPTTYPDFYRLDRDGVLRAYNASGVPNIVAFVSPGVDSSLQSVSFAPVALQAKILLYVSAASGCDTFLTVRNKTTGSESSAQYTSTTLQPVWLTLTDIPCKEATWNELDLGVSVSDDSVTVHILNVTLSETRPTSQRESDGVYPYLSVPKP